MTEFWRANAEARLDDVVKNGDDNGTVANCTADELRDVLVVAAEQLRQAYEILVFADGCVLAGNRKFGDFEFVLADLYAEDCEWAQDTLRRAGCHERGKFLQNNFDRILYGGDRDALQASDDEMNAAVAEAMFGPELVREHQLRGQIVANNLRASGYELVRVVEH